MRVGIMAIFFAIFGTFSATSGRPQDTKKPLNHGISRTVERFFQFCRWWDSNPMKGLKYAHFTRFFEFVGIRVGILDKKNKGTPKDAPLHMSDILRQS